MNPIILSIAGLGFVLGLKHATEPDHVTAVSTIVSKYKGLSASAMVGLSWGIGHSATLFLIAVPILIFRLTVPSSLGPLADGGVGLILAALGLLVLRDLRRERVHIHTHDHGIRAHLHFHSHLVDDGHEHKHKFALRPRSVVIGLLQGMSGSAALMLIALTTLDSPNAGLIFVAFYNLAIVLGILAFTVAFGMSITLTANRVPSLNRAIQLIAALASVFIGAALVWESMLQVMGML